MAYRIFFLGTIFTLIVSSATAHTLWVNAFKSQGHLPAHVLCSIGWGHTTPLDDLPQMVKLTSYTLYGPDLKETPLPMPVAKPSDSFDTDNGLTVVSGDIGARKIILKEGCKPGTYQVGVKSQDNYYTHYLNKNDQTKWAMKPKDEVTDAKKLFRGMLYRATAVSYFTVEKWQVPQSLGYDLEILPLTDLSDIRAGDLVQFRILFRGKNLNTSPEVSIEYITAASDSFGGSDSFTLSCPIFDGKGQFRMPAAGQWLVNVYTRQEVTADNDLKHLVKKCDTALFSSSITFKVNP